MPWHGKFCTGQKFKAGNGYNNTAYGKKRGGKKTKQTNVTTAKPVNKGANSTTTTVTTTNTKTKLKSDGTPDKRFKENKVSTATAGPTKKNGTPDMRYKANKKKG
ncbi:MAG: hypothetical protein J7502_08435 [Flavisolibacter sp.]|nr:hypothetical protein [Flavisolibacter sp.]